jgi:predicted nucleic acid-binding protein
LILVDTNLLARLTDKSHAHHPIARTAVFNLSARREQLVVVPQNLYEFWAVATRKAGKKSAGGENGLGMSIAVAKWWMDYLQRRFTVLPDRDDLFTRWRDLVVTRQIRGLPAHDARLVASMQGYGVTQLLTFNLKDFAGLVPTLIDPATVP